MAAQAVADRACCKSFQPRTSVYGSDSHSLVRKVCLSRHLITKETPHPRSDFRCSRQHSWRGGVAKHSESGGGLRSTVGPVYKSAETSTRKGQSEQVRRTRVRAQTDRSEELETGQSSDGTSNNPAFYETPSFWVQGGVVLTILAYLDAAFSGDWSRIGVLSKETEENLRMGAYFVVPVMLGLAWWLGSVIKKFGAPRTR